MEIPATKRPKAEKIDAALIKGGQRKEVFTVYKYLTDNDSNPRRVVYLKSLVDRKGPWRDFYDFFVKNMSGDFETMRASDRAYVEKMKKDLIHLYDSEMK